MAPAVALRAFQLADSAELALLINTPQVLNNLRDAIPSPYRIEDAKTFIQLTTAEKPMANFAIVYNGLLSGGIGLKTQTDVYRKSAELGYWVAPAFWGKGIASEAVKQITTYGFDVLKLMRIYAGVYAYNQSSMRVLEKNGYQHEGILRKAVYKNQHYWDEHRYALLRPDETNLHER